MTEEDIFGVKQPLEEPEPIEFIYETARGYGMYRQKAGHGGYSYFSDDIGGGRLVWDDGLSDKEMLLELWAWKEANE